MNTTSSDSAPPSPRIALIGCGAIAESFYLPTLKKIMPIHERLVLVDSNPDRARVMADRFGAASIVTDFREVLGSVDGAIVAVPHHLHVPISREFLARGVHTLCEKPLAESGAEVRELVALAKANRTTLSVNNTRRLVPTVTKVKELIDKGTIGELRSISYLEGGEFDWPTASGFYFNSKVSKKGVLIDVGAHALDVICLWLGAKPSVVSSQNDSFGGCEAVASLLLKHKDCTCRVRLSRLSKLPNTFRIVGEHGTIDGPIYEWRDFLLTAADGTSRTVRTYDPALSNFPEWPVINFLDILTRGSAPLIPAHAVLDSIELIEEGYRAASRFPMPWYDLKEHLHEH